MKSTEMSGDFGDDAPLCPSNSKKNIYAAALSAVLYIVVLGMVSSYSAPATVDMVKPGGRFRDLTPDQVTWIASLPNLSGVIGNALSGYLSHKLGRKAVLMYISATYTMGWLLIAYATSIPFIYAGRLVSGFCAGISSVAVPAYIVEVSTIQIRGFLTAGFQVGFASGVFIVMFLGIFLRWSWLAVSGAVVVVTAAVLLLFMPESPPWLVKNSKIKEATRGLKFLRGKHFDAITEIKEIQENQALEPESGIVFSDLFSPLLYKPILIVVALMFFQQFCGINALMSFTVDVFEQMGSSFDPHVAATVIAGVQLVGTSTSSFLMDKSGRKKLYMFSGALMTLSLTALGAYTYLSKGYDAGKLTHLSWIPLISFMLYMAAFSCGFGPIPFVLAPELVPIHLRSLLLAITAVSASFFGFVVTKLFEDMRSTLGLYGVYWVYAAFAFLGFLFYWIFVPETKGRTILDIHSSFSKSGGSSASKA